MNDSRYKRIILNTPSKKLGYKLKANEIGNNVKYNYITFLNAKLSNIFHYSILIFWKSYIRFICNICCPYAN